MMWAYFGIGVVVALAMGMLLAEKLKVMAANRQVQAEKGRLYNLAAKGDLAGVERLLKKEAPVDDAAPDGRTALHLASQRAHEEVAGLLLTYGAAVNQADREGETPLHMCCVATTSAKSRYRYYRIADQLLKKRAHVNAKNHRGVTPLNLAVRNGRHDMVDLLLEHRADPNVRDKEGYTAFFWAQKGDNLDTIKKLQKAGGVE